MAKARLAARTVVGSPLVKAAVNGGDPNWGRVMAAVGRSGAEVMESIKVVAQALDKKSKAIGSGSEAKRQTPRLKVTTGSSTAVLVFARRPRCSDPTQSTHRAVGSTRETGSPSIAAPSTQ